MDRPLIFITNDDSYYSKGIKLLIDIASSFGDVVVLAPLTQQSGKSHSITISEPLRFHKMEEREGFIGYACWGTPVDCVKIAMDIILRERKPSLLLSGINHGSNASINTIYSGTMAAVFEGCLENIPSIGFSVECHDENADFSYCTSSIKKIVKEVLDNGLDRNVCLNVNFPDKEIKGLKVAHQAKAYWNETFVERKDPMGGTYYWLSGKFIPDEKEKNADFNVLRQGYGSITPMQVDFTAYNVLENYKKRFE
ncbi:MAG: 5'/3'-nucleotidase SurE [Bacteroidales bacterium]|nr:5'/3'-nucleotidase SurE [Bacteroidales bacterium]